MTKETVSSIKSKVHWFVIPIVISMMSWMFLTLWNVNENVKVLQTEGRNREVLQEKIYTNLEHKLDVNVYEVKHKEVIADIDRLNVKVDKISARLNISYSDNFRNNANSVISLRDITSNQDTIMNYLEIKNMVESEHTGISNLVWNDIVTNKNTKNNIYTIEYLKRSKNNYRSDGN